MENWGGLRHSGQRFQSPPALSFSAHTSEKQKTHILRNQTWWSYSTTFATDLSWKLIETGHMAFWNLKLSMKPWPCTEQATAHHSVQSESLTSFFTESFTSVSSLMCNLDHEAPKPQTSIVRIRHGIVHSNVSSRSAVVPRLIWSKDFSRLRMWYMMTYGHKNLPSDFIDFVSPENTTRSTGNCLSSLPCGRHACRSYGVCGTT